MNGLRLELDSRRDLSSPPTAEFTAARAGDLAKAVIGNVELRITEIDAVGDVGERGRQL